MSTPKKLLACAKCYKLHRKCTGETRPCDYCKERKLECIENPDRKKRGRPKGSKNKFKSTPQIQNENNNNASSGITNLEIQNIIEITRKRTHNNNNNINNTYNSQFPSVDQDPRIYMEYQKRQKIMAQQQNENYQQQHNQYIQPQYIQQPPNYINNTPSFQYGHNDEYYPPQQQQNISSQQYHQRMQNNSNNNNNNKANNLIHHNIIPHSEIYENHQYSSPNNNNNNNNNTNEYQQPLQYSSFNTSQEIIADSNETEDVPSYNSTTPIPINYNQRRDLIIAPEKLSSSNNNNSPFHKHCIKCQTEMLNFKFCPHCGTPRERTQESKSLIPTISRKKLLSLAILEIVNENNTSFNKDDQETSLQTIWFVVKHPKITSNSSNGTVNLLGDFSLLSTVIKQVSPNWNTFLGYKTSESEKIPLSKFVPANIEISPKSSSLWDSLSDHTSRNSTANFSCEFVLCHKYGVIYGVELQVTTFACNGLPDTSFIVVKKHWNLMNVSEASQILNGPNLEFLSDRALLSFDEEDDDEPSINNPNFELLRKAVDYKNLN